MVYILVTNVSDTYFDTFAYVLQMRVIFISYGKALNIYYKRWRKRLFDVGDVKTKSLKRGAHMQRSVNRFIHAQPVPWKRSRVILTDQIIKLEIGRS